MNKSEILCETCNCVFTSEESLRVHLANNCLHGSHFCDECGKIFSHLRNLKRHKESCNVNVKVKVYACEVCNKSYSRLDNLKRHAKQHGIRVNDKMMMSFVDYATEKSCFRCKKTFANVNSRNYHNCKDVSLCHNCGKTFVYSKKFQKHVAVCETLVHAKRFSCILCDESMSSNYNLRRHMLRSHKNSMSTDEGCLDQVNMFKIVTDLSISDRKMLKLLQHMRSIYGRKSIMPGDL